MKRVFLFAGCLLLSAVGFAGKPNATDFPLRVHIFGFNGSQHFSGGVLDWVDGEGRANLYEKGEPRGFDFSYRCAERLRVSPGFETYMARWKKLGQTLEILLPVFGKPNAAEGCELKVLMKDTTYIRRNGLLNEEPAAMFKDWMVKHNYDPEHGLNDPVAVQQAEPVAVQPAAGAVNPR